MLSVILVPCKIHRGPWYRGVYEGSWCLLVHCQIYSDLCGVSVVSNYCPLRDPLRFLSQGHMQGKLVVSCPLSSLFRPLCSRSVVSMLDQLRDPLRSLSVSQRHMRWKSVASCPLSNLLWFPCFLCHVYCVLFLLLVFGYIWITLIWPAWLTECKEPIIYLSMIPCALFQEVKEDYTKSLTHYEMALGAIMKLLPSKWFHLCVCELLTEYASFVACYLLTQFHHSIELCEDSMRH